MKILTENLTFAARIYWAKQWTYAALLIFVTMAFLSYLPALNFSTKMRLKFVNFTDYISDLVISDHTIHRCSWDTTISIADQQKRGETVFKLEMLKKKHKELIARFRKVIRTFNPPEQSMHYLGEKFTSLEAYENIRRRIYSNLQELELYLKYKLTVADNKTISVEEQRIALKLALERKRSLLSDQERLAEVDGHADWRSREARRVRDLVQRRLRYLQNPQDCRGQKKLVCYLNKNFCGFGCQIHHVVYCLIFAYATERTMILNSEDWNYYRNGWDHMFYPLSEFCTSVYNETIVPWPASDDTNVISVPFLEALPAKPRFLPLAIPIDLESSIVKFNGDPASWWIGQMLAFILKPRTTLQDTINKTIAAIHFESPIVGVHVRRTDKIGVEADLYDISEYMQHVDEYYAQLDLTRTLTHRSVYLATDEPRVFEEARLKYPHYTFYGDPEIAQTAKKDRYTPQSLTGVIVNLHLLAKCDYFVGTFTSQISRVVYELMQANRADASQSYASLDDAYHFVGQTQLNRIYVFPEKNLQHDTSFKWSYRDKHAQIPWYKTVSQLLLYSFPEYKEVPLS